MATKVKMLDLQEQYFSIRGEVRRVLDEVCDAQDFILGPRVERFEQNLAKYCGTKHAIGVSSGTDALLCSLMALEIGPGDEVICPAFTFFATAGSIARTGARPVFADVDPGTFNIDPADVKRKLTDRDALLHSACHERKHPPLLILNKGASIPSTLASGGYQSWHHSATFPCISYSPHAFGSSFPPGFVPPSPCIVHHM